MAEIAEKKKRTTKKAATATAKAAEAPKESEVEQTTPAEKTYSEDDVKRLVAEAMAGLKKELEEAKAAAAAPVQAPAAPEGVVTIMLMAECNKNNILELKGYGILRPSSYLEIPKKEFGGKFMTQLARQLIDKRHILVVSGLNKDERLRWNCDYKPGEVLDENLFDHLLDLPISRLVELFPQLCDEHKMFVVRRFITAQENKDNRLSLEKIEAMNRCAKQCGALVDGKSIFQPILDRAAEAIKERD